MIFSNPVPKGHELKLSCLYDYCMCIVTTYFILTGVMKRNPLTTDTTHDYEDSVRVWFSNARDRTGGRENRPRSHHVNNE